MREYCSDAIQLFKPIVEAVNSPLASLHFRSFADLVTKVRGERESFASRGVKTGPALTLSWCAHAFQEIELLVPIAKMIQHDRYKYAAFDKFPLGIKVFINSIVVFVDAVSVYKQYGRTPPPLVMRFSPPPCAVPRLQARRQHRAEHGQPPEGRTHERAQDAPRHHPQGHRQRRALNPKIRKNDLKIIKKRNAATAHSAYAVM